MAIKTADELKAEFAAGKYPTQTSFEDLIDTTAGGSSITTYDSTSSMFNEDLPQGTIQIYYNTSTSSTSIQFPNNDSQLTVYVAAASAVAFVKTSASGTNSWNLLGTAIQGGGSGSVC